MSKSYQSISKISSLYLPQLSILKFKLLDCALQSKADFIVSVDKNLLKKFKKTKIITQKEFLNFMREGNLFQEEE